MTAGTETSYRIVGEITRSHGLRGGLKVRPETDDPYRFDDLETVFLGASEDSLRPYSIQEADYQPMKSGLAVLLQLKGVDDRDQADALRGTVVWARTEDLPPLEDGEVFLSDLVGLAVYGQDGGLLGEVTDVLELPAHPTLTVTLTHGGTALVPFVSDLVPDVDLEQGRLTVAAVDGLLEGEGVSERD